MLVSLNRIVALAGCALLLVGCEQEDVATGPVATAQIGVQAAPTTYGSEVGTFTLTKDRANSDYCVLKVALRGLYDNNGTSDDYYHVYYGTSTWANPIGPQIEDQQISDRGTYRGQMSIASWVFVNPAYTHWLAYSGSLSSDWKVIPSTDLKLVNRCY